MQEEGFLRAVLALKRLNRAGWERVGLKGTESVADHSFGVSALAVLFTPEGMDHGRVMRIAAVHDLAEAEIGDITPWDKVDKGEKSRKEHAAIQKITAGLDARRAREVRDLWEDYESGRTAEGRLVKQLDKLDMALTALDYEEKHGRFNACDEFWESADKGIAEPQLRAVFEALRKKRPKSK
jgi:putative hydrolase of HD superfamily